MNDAMVTHAFIDQYDKIWFHENEKALIYYDPLNHTAKTVSVYHVRQDNHPVFGRCR